ncbi:hypothetical protein BC830DRAFT_288813 [Chytriomyces sp. MP71]|nr:hypothetical protein BC830DRAFT_288813 [Chytriomyces sp. MP71]
MGDQQGDETGSEFIFETDVDDLFGDGSDVTEAATASRHRMPSSYEYPLAADGVYSVPGSDTATLLNHETSTETFNRLFFHGGKLAPTSLAQHIEHAYLRRDYLTVQHLSTLWLAANASQPKPFSTLELCDMAARAALRKGDPHSAAAYLTQCTDLDWRKPTQTTAGLLPLRARVESARAHPLAALEALHSYLLVRPRDYRVYVDVGEVVRHLRGYDDDGAVLRMVHALAVRRGRRLLEKSSEQPALMRAPIVQRHREVFVRRLDEMLEGFGALLDSFDANVEERRKELMVALKEAIRSTEETALDGMREEAALSTEVWEWIRDDVLMSGIAAKDAIGLDDEEDEDERNAVSTL